MAEAQKQGADTVQLIKEKISIVEVVSPYVKLAKAGKYLRGLSPFTKEKTPSFFVNLERNSYYCFSTGQGGDMFTFIEKMEGVDFKGALKILAEKAGVEVVYSAEGSANRDRLDRLRDAMAQAVAYFERNLAPAGGAADGSAAASVESSAYSYAKSRGLTDETIRSWQLGFAPDAWRGLLDELAAKGFTTQELVAAGLVKEADGRAGTWYDRFRNRLMFPIKDIAGRTVAFTGRALSPDDQAKYLNSPETELFHKSDVLMGMDRAKDAIRSRGFAILVEGQFDLLLLHQIGFTNTIALSGTALSQQHLTLIKRYADNLMLCLDADRAGLASSSKSAHAALAMGMRVKAVRLPAGKDPADLASTDPKDFAKRIADATSIVEFFLGVLASSETDAHKLVLAAEETVLPLIAAVPSPLEREHFIGITSRSLGMPPEAIRSALGRIPAQSAQPPQAAARTESSGSRVLSHEGGHGGARNFNERNPNGRQQNAVKPSAQRGQMLLAVADNYPDSDLAERLRNEYTRVIGASVPDEPLPERVLFEAGLAYGELPSESEISELVRMFEHAVLTERLQEATAALRRAELSGDTEMIGSLFARCKELSAQLASI